MTDSNNNLTLDSFKDIPLTTLGHRTNLAGMEFSSLTVLRYAGIGKYGHRLWLCKCCCGSLRALATGKLLGGSQKSCGCLKKFRLAALFYKHGGAAAGKNRSREYRIWSGILTRSFNPNAKSYKGYGAVGIRACAGTAKSFEHFIATVGRQPSEKHEIDRTINSKGYLCGNCQECNALNEPMNMRWVTRAENSLNKRTNRLVTFRETTKPLISWARELELDYSMLSWRLDSGWDIERALTTQSAKTLRCRNISQILPE